MRISTKNCLRIGVYGDVQRVKILYNKKDSALIQMAEPHQAHLGNGFELFTCRVKVYFAKEGLFV